MFIRRKKYDEIIARLQRLDGEIFKLKTMHDYPTVYHPFGTMDDVDKVEALDKRFADLEKKLDKRTLMKPDNLWGYSRWVWTAFGLPPLSQSSGISVADIAKQLLSHLGLRAMREAAQPERVVLEPVQPVKGGSKCRKKH